MRRAIETAAQLVATMLALVVATAVACVLAPFAAVAIVVDHLRNDRR